MKLTRCPNKHFYDSHKHAACPYCEAKEAPNKPEVQSQTPVVQSPPKIDHQMHTQYIGNEEQVSAAPAQWGDKTVWMNEEESQSAIPAQPAVSAQSAIPAQSTVSEQPTPEKKQEDMSDFQKQVAASRSSVHTNAAANSGKTVAFYDTGDSDPVVGWLICVKGEYVGESFNLKAGQNFIGRSLSMDVALVNENSISREFHAGIIFEPNEGKFFGVPGQSNGLTYVNDELLFSPKPLNAYDRIKLGKSLYIFMPFCGENFNWDTYLGNE